MAGAEVTPPPPARQWPARIAACLALTQTLVLVVATLCAWWEKQSVAGEHAVIVARHPELADYASQATAEISGIYQNMVIYSVAMAPLFLGGGIWLLRGRSVQSRVVAIVVAVLASVCCICAGCFTDSTTRSTATDAFIDAASASGSDDLIATLADSWALTPVVAMVLVILLCVQISWDNAAHARMTVFLARNAGRDAVLFDHWPPPSEPASS